MEPDHNGADRTEAGSRTEDSSAEPTPQHVTMAVANKVCFIRDFILTHSFVITYLIIIPKSNWATGFWGFGVLGFWVGMT